MRYAPLLACALPCAVPFLGLFSAARALTAVSTAPIALMHTSTHRSRRLQGPAAIQTLSSQQYDFLPSTLMLLAAAFFCCYAFRGKMGVICHSLLA